MAKLEDMIVPNGEQFIRKELKNAIDEQLDEMASNLTPEEIGTNQPMSDIMIDRMNGAIDDFIEALDTTKHSIPDYVLTDPEIVGYDDDEFQQAIYRWALSTCRSGTSVKDLGCGRGDFRATINSEFWPSSPEYIGIDFNSLMVGAAKKKYEGIDVRHGDWLTLTDQTDYTFCIGSLNDDNGQDKWEVFTNALFHALGNTANQVIFIFNVGESAEGSFSFELDKLMTILPAGYPFQIDCSRFEGICKLVVYCKKFE